MTSIFYSYEEITAELDVPNLEERRELVKIIDETFRHHALDSILTHLPHEHHETFMSRFHFEPHDHNLLNYLKNHIPDIESKLLNHLSKIKKDILSDIKKSKTP